MWSRERCGVRHTSDLQAIRQIELEPDYTGSIKTKAVKLGKQKRMVYSVKSLRNIKEENCNKLLLIKCLVPFVSAMQKKGLS